MPVAWFLIIASFAILRQAEGAVAEVLPSRRPPEPFSPVCGFHMVPQPGRAHSRNLHSYTLF
jgi:hypothetical protein